MIMILLLCVIRILSCHSEDINTKTNIRAANDIDSKSTLTIMLPKYSFKKYEPILALLKYTNKNSKNDTVYNIFNELHEALSFVITPLDGQYYRMFSPGYSIHTLPSYYIIEPNDTLSISREINKFGVDFKEQQAYLGMEGYLNPGRYRLYARGIARNIEYISDTVAFSVIELNDEDRLILDLLSKGKYEEILENYSNNSLSEAIFAYYVNKTFQPKFTKYYGSKNDILNLYKGFYDKFKNSYYGFKQSFVYYMFIKLSALSEDISLDIQSFKNKYPVSSLYDFLSQEPILDKIYKTDIQRKKEMDDYRKNPNGIYESDN